MDISFKPLELSAVDDLLIFVQEYYDYDHLPWKPEATRRALENLVTHPDWGRVWFICRDAQPIGYVVLTLSYSLEYLGRDAFVDEIYLREEARGQGIGSATFRFLQSFCRSLSINALHLEVEHDNDQALKFYRKLSFVQHERYLMTCWLNAHEP